MERKRTHFSRLWRENPFSRDGHPKTRGNDNDICVATGITVRCAADATCRQCTGKRLSRAILVVLQQGEDVAFV